MTEVKGKAERCYYNICQQDRIADVYIYGDITHYPFAPNGDVSAYNLAQEIAALDVDTINVCINSIGGNVSEGLAIYSALCRHPAKIITHCDGFACSAASVIFMAGDERLMSDVGLLMIHEASVMASGNAAELQKAAEDLAKITDTAAAAYRSRVNISDDELEDLLAAESWLTPREAVAMGFATGIESWGENAGVAMSAQGRIAELVLRGLAQKAPEKAPDKQQMAGADLAGTVAGLAEMKNDIKSLLAGMSELAVAMKAEPKQPETPTGGFFNFKKSE